MKKHCKLIVKIELLFLAIAFIAEIVQAVNFFPNLKNTIALATTVKPETFTELYFEDHTQLPKTIKKGEGYSFVFTAHNVEYQDMKYSYIVYLQRDNQKITLDEGEFSLKNNEYKSVKENFGPLKNLRAKILVELVNKNQQIDFWMEQI
ncbi:MAG: DUF1616 domain-containing protein [Patescibacteria group bacterium]|nr:DUF1616 domain-containing protein [Patescibacteria group bacterium]